MTTAELTQWEVARGRLDVTIAKQAETIARLRDVSERLANEAATWAEADDTDLTWTDLGELVLETRAALEDTRD